jgi:BioD-like phosphotransacetylase family protein
MRNLFVGMVTIAWLGSGIRLNISHFASNKQAFLSTGCPLSTTPLSPSSKGLLRKMAEKYPTLALPLMFILADLVGSCSQTIQV